MIFKYFIYILISLSLCLLPASANSQTILDLSYDKYVENILPGEYKGDVQIWDIKTDEEFVFIATANGLSVYDGVQWRNYSIANHPILRCIDYDKQQQRIYSGADNEFGYWEKDNCGQYRYTKLYENSNPNTSDIFWRVYSIQDHVFFQTHTDVYSYNKQTGEIETILSGNNIGYLHQLENDIYVQSDRKLLELKGKEFVYTGLDFQERIVGIYQFNGKLVFVTEEDGIQYLTDGELHSLDNGVNEQLVKARLFSSSQLNDSIILLGSVLDGLFYIDKNLNISSHINYDKGLNHSTILSIAINKESDIWLGLDGGMACIKQNPQEILLQSKNKDIGTIYDAIWYKNKLYVATNKGLYRWENNDQITFINGSQGQIWSLKVLGKIVAVCHDNGLYLFDGNKLTLKSKTKIWKLKSINDKLHYLSLDYEGGFSIFESTDNDLKFVKKIEGFNGAHTDAGVDRFGQIWVQDRSASPTRIKLDNYFNVEKIEKYGLPQGVSLLNRADLDNDIVFFDKRTAYTYDISTNGFVLNNYYSELLKQMLFDPSCIIQDKDVFFYVSRNRSAYIKRFNDKFYNYGEFFQIFDNSSVPAFAHRLISINNDLIAMGFPNGIAFYSVENQNLDSLKKKSLKITEVLLIEKERESFLPISETEILEIPFNYSNIQLFFSGLYAHRQIYYSLNDGDWILSKAFPYLQLPSLSSGEYTVKIKNMESGHTAGNIITLNLKIEKPWYRTYVFYTIILIAVIGISLLINTIFERKIKTQQEIAIKRQNRLLENEKKEYELKLLKLRIREKEKQLVTLTMDSIKRNATLTEVRKEIALVSSDSDNSQLKSKLKRIIRNINFHLSKNETHELFEKYFNEVYDGFFDRLLKKHPTLTQHELKLCAYIKLGLNTKEIATYTNISPSSVEIARHRLRKKLKIKQEENLLSYISNI